MKFSLRVTMFFIVALSIWFSLNAYFLWRILSLPLFSGRFTRAFSITLVVFFALSYLLGRIFVHRGYGGFAAFLEIVGAIWMGALFIFVVYLLFADILTLFGYFKSASVLSRYAALTLSLFLIILSLYLGLRTPVLREEVVQTSNPQLTGLRIVQISDLHLGAIKGEKFLKKVVKKVNEQNPDIVVLTGDIIDTDGKKEEGFKNIFKEIKASKGIYAVLGNHEYYHGAEKNPKFFEESGMVLLRNKNVEAIDGLVVAGIDDISHKRQFGNGEDFLAKALENRKEGYLVLLSHSPLDVEKAADMGVNLVLSGHCHNGQIWPFKFFSKMFYPYNYGRFKIKNMDLIVTLGTGTWGPPMRLFKHSEMVLIIFK